MPKHKKNATVANRRVHYFGGFDPRGAGYYHGLLSEEALKPQPQGGVLWVGPRKRLGAACHVWDVEFTNAAAPHRSTHTEHMYMGWDDLVRAHWVKGVWALLRVALVTYAFILWHMRPLHLGRLYWPVYVTGAVPLASLLVVGVIAAGLWWVLPWGLGAMAALVVVFGGWRWADSVGVFWLLRILHFLVVFGRGQAQGFDDRAKAWVEQMVQRQQHNPVDEVVLVGHSVGTVVMLQAVLLLLNDERWQALQAGRPTLVITLGQIYPFVVQVPQAYKFRGTLKALCQQQGLRWFDVTARIDPMCFYNTHPLASAPPDDKAAEGRAQTSPQWPVLYKASFIKMYSALSWKKLRRQKLQTHFLYLKTPERCGNFMLQDVLYGPYSLMQRTKAEPPNLGAFVD